MPAVRITYYSDILCVWAYLGQRRLDQLAEAFGEDISIETHYFSVFSDAWGKIETNWKDRGGFDGFGKHLEAVGRQYPHIDVNPRIWRDVRPRTSASAHLFLKAIDRIEQAAASDVPPYRDRLSTRAAWEIRTAFFSAGRDISDWRVLAEIVGHIGLDIDVIDEKIRSSEAVTQLAADYDLSRLHAVEVSPTLIMNEGRQRLHGNVGYRLIDANVQELLRASTQDEASWC